MPSLPRKTGATVRAVTKEIETITGLTPFPGNEFSNEQTNYIVPDVYVYKVDDEYVIQLNNDGLPQLKLSDDYLELLKQKRDLNPESIGYLREKQRSAEWFIKSLQQRQRTIYKVMESILKFQRDFFEYGSGPPEAPDSQRRGRRHRHARINGQPGNIKQICPHSPGNL